MPQWEISAKGNRIDEMAPKLSMALESASAESAGADRDQTVHNASMRNAAPQLGGDGLDLAHDPEDVEPRHLGDVLEAPATAHEFDEQRRVAGNVLDPLGQGADPVVVRAQPGRRSHGALVVQCCARNASKSPISTMNHSNCIMVRQMPFCH